MFTATVCSTYSVSHAASCEDEFARLKKDQPTQSQTRQTDKENLQAFLKNSTAVTELKYIGNPVTFKQDIEARRGKWNKLNPRDLNNFPTPEHREVVDEMKKLIAKLPEKRRPKWEKQIADLEARNLPYTDTAVVNERFANYLTTRANAQDGESRNRSLKLYEKLAKAHSLPAEKRDRIDVLIDQILEDNIGDDDSKKVHEIENLVLQHIKAHAPSDQFQEVVKQVKRARKADALAHLKEREKLESARRVMAKNAIYLTTSNLSIRELVEAFMLDFGPVQFVSRKREADLQTMSPFNFIGHDYGHASASVWKTYKKPALRDRVNLLAEIDKVDDVKLRKGIETVLFEFMHEDLTIIAGNAIDQRHVIPKNIHRKYREVSEEHAHQAMLWLERNFFSKLNAPDREPYL